MSWIASPQLLPMLQAAAKRRRRLTKAQQDLAPTQVLAVAPMETPMRFWLLLSSRRLSLRAKRQSTLFQRAPSIVLMGFFLLLPWGYVRCPRPPFDGGLLGLVGNSNGGRRIFASCRLHPKCDIACGVVREPVSRMKLAEWLATGVPCAEAPAERRRRLGERHRTKWSRHGPLGAGGDSSE